MVLFSRVHVDLQGVDQDATMETKHEEEKNTLLATFVEQAQRLKPRGQNTKQTAIKRTK